jgi:hypothetical protein
MEQPISPQDLSALLKKMKELTRQLDQEVKNRKLQEQNPPRSRFWTKHKQDNKPTFGVVGTQQVLPTALGNKNAIDLQKHAQISIDSDAASTNSSAYLTPPHSPNSPLADSEHDFNRTEVKPDDDDFTHPNSEIDPPEEPDDNGDAPHEGVNEHD